MTEWSLFVSKANHSISQITNHAPTSNAEEAEVEQFFEDLKNILELTPIKDVLFIIGDWNAKKEERGAETSYDIDCMQNIRKHDTYEAYKTEIWFLEGREAGGGKG